MTAPPNSLTEIPKLDDDPVNEILDAMRLSGGIFLEADFRGQWSIASHFHPNQCALFFPVTGSLIGYHYVKEGSMWVTAAGLPPQEAKQGSVVVFPRNDQHRLFSADVETVSSQSLLDLSDPSGIVRMKLGTEGDLTSIFCGFLSTATSDTPLLDHLPAMLILQPDEALRTGWIESSFQYALDAGQPLSTSEVGRLAELLVKASLRAHLRSLESHEPDWLRGLRDRHISRALKLIHQNFAKPIDLEWLSREVGLSRSSLQDRFKQMMGESPIRYCARWRLRQAANLLRETEFSSSTIAFEVGYTSEAAFSRAFRRDYGEPPSTWRQRKANQLTGRGTLG